MSVPAVQLSFTLRTSPNVRTVHLVGSWDGYKNQLPLSVSKDATAKPGSWKGTFRFQGAHALKLGSRYWYYYIVDGYHVSHDPAKEHVVEKTTGRKLNILNVPAAEKKRPAPINTKLQTTQPMKTPNVPTGKALSPTKIFHPRPQKPYASQGLREADYDHSPIDDLEERFGSVNLSERKYMSSPSDLSELSESSGTVFSSSSASNSSCTSESDDDTQCRCNRFGVTRDGRRVMLDCGGKRCGYADSESSSECDSEDEEYDRQQELRQRARAQLAAERARNGVSTKAAPAATTTRARAVAGRR